MTHIIITQRHNQDQYGQYRDSLESNYLSLFKSFDPYILALPNTLLDTKAYLEKYQPTHIVLTGGDDIGGKFPPTKENPREHTEWACLEWAISNNIPVFGICRGFQFINLFFGGKVCLDIHQLDSKHTPGNDHLISLSPDLNLDMEKAVVNSYHNQGIELSQLAPNLKLLAHKDGLVESFQHHTLPITGVQWHPEREDKLSKLNLLMLNYFINNEFFLENK